MVATIAGTTRSVAHGPKAGRGTRSSSPRSAPVAQTQRPAPGVGSWAKAEPGVVVYSHRSAVQLFSHTSGPFFSREQLPIQRASLVENLAAAGSSRVRRACRTNGIFGMMVMFDIDICCPLGDVSALGDQAVL